MISLLTVAVACPVSGRAQQATPKIAQGASMAHISGSFDVKVTPQADTTVAGLSRLALDKQFHGELEATSKGEMLASGGSTGTGGYVAMEIVTGKLAGRTGSFALQHSGTMIDNAFTLSIVVVPGSGTGEFAGIDGKMNIVIADGRHTYVFDYTLPAR